MIWRLLHKLRYFFATSAAILATALVWLWPQMPIWRSPAKVAWGNCSFSPNGEVIVTSKSSGYSSPQTYRWDANTGKLLSHAEFACQDPNLIKIVYPSLDGRLALVGEGHSPSPSMMSFQSGDFYLHDGITGKRLVGPIGKVQEMWQEPFSPDNRWILAPSLDRQSINIYSAITGELVFSPPKLDHRTVAWFLFPAEGATVAVVYAVKPTEGTDEDTAGHDVIMRTFDLATKQELGHWGLPNRFWTTFGPWTGQKLNATYTVTVPNVGERRVLTLDTAAAADKAISEDPMLVVRQDEKNGPAYCLDSTDCVAYVQILKPDNIPVPWYDGVRQWLTKYINVGYTSPRGVRVSVRVVNRKTKATTFESAEPLGHPVDLSPNGRLLASSTNDEGIAVWDTNPGPRWPWAVGAGTAVLASFWLVGRVWLRFWPSRS